MIAELDSLGFYAYTAPEKVEQVKQEALTSWDLYSIETQRFYHAEAEDLAEGLIGVFLQTDVGLFLARQGIHGLQVEDHLTDEGDYRVTVNGVTYHIYSQQDVADDDGDPWDRCHQALAAILNTLLEQAGSRERAFLLFAGNDAELVFLTRKMYEVMRDARLLDDLPREVNTHLFE